MTPIDSWRGTGLTDCPLAPLPPKETWGFAAITSMFATRDKERDPLTATRSIHDDPSYMMRASRANPVTGFWATVTFVIEWKTCCARRVSPQLDGDV